MPLLAKAVLAATLMIAVGTTAARAAGQQEELNILELPPEPETAPPDEEEVQVTIIRRKDAVIEEYRVNGVLKAVKVTPSVGEPYYLVDTDGNGHMERRLSMSDGLLIPSWVIHSWD